MKENDVTKKISATQQWMDAHPGDVPCPHDPNLAGVWRRKRGLEETASRRRITAIRKKYERAMAEKRRRLSEVA
jgi:hypothetical protein